MNPIPSTILWTVLTAASSTALLGTMVSDSDARRIFLPGKTTSGHYQIELACGACHTDTFGGREQFQAACQKCHAKELEEANDSHPRSKFTDPRNADRIAVLDARECVACHQEHNPAVTQTMGVTLPEDYCYRCHSDIAKDRPSHEGMPFDSCDDAGCHNFHDNRSLYEDYLAKHLDAPDQLPTQQVLAFQKKSPKLDDPLANPVGLPELAPEEQSRLADSAHGKAGLSCGSCHSAGGRAPEYGASQEQCSECHSRQASGWLAGRHGMRVGQGLSPLRVGDARAELNPERAHETLDCNNCHDAHGADTRVAAAEACQGCHTDEHTKAYAGSTHAELWKRELDGDAAPGTGVSCATCHMPRLTDDDRGDVFVQHNQNDNLRPSDKMVRATCIQCHSPGFSLAALSDEALVLNNFSAPPTMPLESMKLVRARVKQTE